jgi:hypothetical protein
VIYAVLSGLDQIGCLPSTYVLGYHIPPLRGGRAISPHPAGKTEVENLSFR